MLEELIVNEKLRQQYFEENEELLSSFLEVPYTKIEEAFSEGNINDKFILFIEFLKWKYQK